MPSAGRFRFPPPKGRRSVPRAAGGGSRAGDHLLAGEVEILLAYLPERQAAKLAHLAGCSGCQELYRQLVQPAPAPHRPKAHEQAEAVERLAAAVRETTRRLADGAKEAEALVGELLQTARSARPRRILHEARFQVPAVACRLFHHSLLAGTEKPEEAESFAALGLLVAGQLTAHGAPAVVVAELEVHGWALIARSRWELGDWPGVREALDTVERLMVEAGYLRQHAGFRPAMRALRLIERRLEDAVTVGAHALHELLAPLFGGPPHGTGSPQAAPTPERGAEP